MDYTRNWLKRNPENFPVASRLLPREARTKLAALYAFARGADEIADGSALPERRRKELLGIEEALAHGNDGALPEWAHAFAALARAHPPLLTAARDLLSAFVQDTVKSRYHNFSELLDYCRNSAAPVGRALLYICGETKADLRASDALCNALQILNHLQDAGDDYVNLGRVYLPLDWFTFAGADVRALAASETGPKLRLVFDHALDNCDRLLLEAKLLSRSIRQRGVRVEAGWIYRLALRLVALLRVRDPLERHVKLSKASILWCLIRAGINP